MKKPSRWTREELLDLAQELYKTAESETQINHPRATSLRLQFELLSFLWSEQYGKDSVDSKKELARLATAGRGETTTNAYIQLVNSGDDFEWKKKIERQQKRGEIVSTEETKEIGEKAKASSGISRA